MSSNVVGGKVSSEACCSEMTMEDRAVYGLRVSTVIFVAVASDLGEITNLGGARPPPAAAWRSLYGASRQL